MNKAIWIIGLASAVLSLPYVIDFFGEHKSVVIVEQLLVQPTTDKSLSGRKIRQPDDLAAVAAQDRAHISELENQSNTTEVSISTISTLLKNEKLDGYSDESRAELIEDLRQKIAQQRIQALEELKASIL